MSSKSAAPRTLAESIAAVRFGGNRWLIGVLAGLDGNISTAAMMLKQAGLHGLIVRNRQHQKEMVRGIEAGGLRPVIDRSFALEEIGQAFAHQTSWGHFEKICLEIRSKGLSFRQICSFIRQERLKFAPFQ